MTNYIWITTQKEGVHQYRDAPSEVSFLKDKHRHIFHFKIYIEIFTNDRDIEFIMFKRYVDSYIQKWPLNLFNHSCESIADDVEEHIRKKYKNRKIMIEISEDGENGIIKSYSKS